MAKMTPRDIAFQRLRSRFGTEVRLKPKKGSLQFLYVTYRDVQFVLCCLPGATGIARKEAFKVSGNGALMMLFDFDKVESHINGVAARHWATTALQASA